MKIYLKDLSYTLKNNLFSIYFIFGDELLLKQEALDLILKKIKSNQNNNQPEIVYLSIDKNFSPGTLINSLSNTSLFSSQLLLRINLEENLNNLFIQELVLWVSRANLPTHLSQNLSPEIQIIIMGPKIPQAKLQEAWFKKLDPHTLFIQIWPIEPAQLPHWISQKARELNLKFHPTALHDLARLTEGNLLATSQALEKLVLLNLPEITLSDIENLQNDMAHFEPYSLIDAWFMNDIPKAQRVFLSLMSQETELTYILFILAQEIRLLANLHTEFLNTHPGLNSPIFLSPELLKKYKIYDKKKLVISQGLRKFNLQNCYEILKTFAKIDRQIKGLELNTEGPELALRAVLK